jgi:hypothetical protein
MLPRTFAEGAEGLRHPELRVRRPTATVIGRRRMGDPPQFFASILTTRVTNVRLASPAFPVTSQHPSVGKIKAVA